LLGPSPGTQEKVGAIVREIDEAIEQTEALIAKTQQIKAGMMHDLFTRGVTPDGQLRPPREQAPQLYKQSPLGWIPKEWDWSTLGSLLAPVSYPMRSGPFGSTLLKDELVGDGIPLLGIDNVFTECFVRKYRRFVTPHKFAELSRYAVFSGDVIITIMGTVGRCCVVPAGIGEALSSKHLWTMTFDHNKVLPELVCWQLNYATWVKSWFARQSQGAVMDAIQSSTLRSLTLPVPHAHEQEILRDRYLAVQEVLAVESERHGKLKQLKNGMMNDLLTGHRLVVPDALKSIKSA
jgi:type I restriction enzyme S subunit